MSGQWTLLLSIPVCLIVLAKMLCNYVVAYNTVQGQILAILAKQIIFILNY